jgi:hypothetical protein
MVLRKHSCIVFFLYFKVLSFCKKKQPQILFRFRGYNSYSNFLVNWRLASSV